MARRVFYSFHYKPDKWRAAQVRHMGVIEGNVPVSDNDWETITRGGDAAIERWIADQRWYIYPLCADHNRHSGELEVSDAYKLVSANKRETCER